MDNQQAKIDETRIAWLAGFIDADGSICMMKTNPNRFKANGKPVGGFVPRLTICNTNWDTLRVIKEIADAFSLPYHICDNTNRLLSKPMHRHSWHFSVQGMKRMIRWLSILLPYMQTKREQTKLALEYSLSRSSKAKNTPLSNRETEILDRFRSHQMPQRLNALSGVRNEANTEWYSPSYKETCRATQK